MRAAIVVVVVSALSARASFAAPLPPLAAAPLLPQQRADIIGVDSMGLTSLGGVLGATHWSPCYYLNASLPSLLDGAQALAASGSRALKLILDADVNSTYPWNSDWGPQLVGVSDLAGLVATPYYDAVLGGVFSTVALITYRVSSPGGTWNYWCDEFSPADAAGETRELQGLTQHLLTRFAGSGKTFLIEHWEGVRAQRGIR